MSSIGRKLVLLSFVLLLAACAQAEPAPTATPAPPTATGELEPEPVATPEPEAQTDGTVVLTLTGPEGTREFTMAELQALPAVEGWGGLKNSVGNITVPAYYTGVALKDLLDMVGGLEEAAGVNVIAEDGYAMTLAYDQAYANNFITYDPATGDEVNHNEELVSVLAYAVDGEPLPERSDGKLRLMVLGPTNNQVTDGHWWVKWVAAVVTIDQGEQWFLSLDGALSEEMDRATFESCSSPSCHAAYWTDEEGNEWHGTPLYLVAARVDDENRHDFGGFNVELAENGYTIEMVAADGYAVEIDSVAAMRNPNMIVAVGMDGEALPEAFYPLRLVGSDLAKEQMVGQITSVRVILQPVSQEEPALTVGGEVVSELALSMEDLEALGVEQRTLEHPRDGAQDYKGVMLNALLAAAAPQWKADTLQLTAADGYAVELPLADAKACTDCMIAFDGENGLMSVMPDMANSIWIKELVALDLLAPAGAEEASAAALTVSGAVENALTLTTDAFGGLELVQLTAEYGDKGTMDYEGVRLIDLLALAGPAGDATGINLVAADGYAAEVTMADVLACADCLIGLDGEGGFMSVMPELSSGAWVKDLVAIEVLAPTSDLPQAGEGEAALTVDGLVAQPLSLSMEGLRGLDVVQLTVEHPKKGMVDYEGVLLSELLAHAGPAGEAASLRFAASDGYASEVSLAEAQACADCMVSLADDGTLLIVMPGFSTEAWVKMLASITVQ